MVEDGLGEGLATGGLSKVGVEAERLGDGEVGYISAQAFGEESMVQRGYQTHPSWCTEEYPGAARQRTPDHVGR